MNQTKVNNKLGGKTELLSSRLKGHSPGLRVDSPRQQFDLSELKVVSLVLKVSCSCRGTKPRYSPSANQRTKACSGPPRVTRDFYNNL